MTRVPKRAKPKTRHYRCARCHSLVPTQYAVCASCGYNHARLDQLMRDARKMFPGSVEL